jgi:flagellum-specific ATP synthase
MQSEVYENLIGSITGVPLAQPMGRVAGVQSNFIIIKGLVDMLASGDRVEILRRDAPVLAGEVVQLHPDHAVVFPEGAVAAVRLNDVVLPRSALALYPCTGWLGRVISPLGSPLDGRPLPRGHVPHTTDGPAVSALQRRALGPRVATGLRVFNTLLPLVRGQRLGLFAGSGVGKTNLLGQLAKGVQADVAVIALIGERGREVTEFIEKNLGEAGLKRCVIVVATSDQPANIRRQCAASAMTIAEFFRDQGQHVLLLADSLTRFAEAHREVALAAGEGAHMRGFPASTAHRLMALAERAGPGRQGMGDISAIFTVLVAGSDMDEPIADILRGVMDGHIVMDRRIAERGRFPAINLPASVSRSLPHAASPEENIQITEARRLLASYDENETMLRAGLYAPGSDPLLDRAISVWPELDAFLAEPEPGTVADSFARLTLILRRAAQVGRQSG